jgi:hypothetical protein
MTLVAARQVADAVLYEGYLLYPYRATSPKNQLRWQFGVLGPEGAAQAGTGEPPTMSAEVLLQPGRDPRVDVHLRFLQVQARTVERRTSDGWEPVDELLVAASRWIAFHEAVAREVTLRALPLAAASVDVEVPAGEEVEELVAAGEVVGRLVRTRWAVSGTVTVTARQGTDPRLVVLSLGVRNRTVWTTREDPGWAARDVAARCSFVGTHLLVTAQDARFVSLLDGPAWADPDARSCRSDRCWPVLVADDDGADAVLVAPIALGDHPAVAPESAGDLFDATEIDEILTLRVMTMTEAEKAEARGTDPRAAAVLARCDAMSEDELGRLHGAQRGSTLPVLEDELPWWDEGQDARARPETDAVLIGDVRVAPGSRVLLRPSRRADAQDLFLAGMTAVVARVYFDVDGQTHLAVMLEDDPGSDLYRATGRYYYFAPDEVEPLAARQDAP